LKLPTLTSFTPRLAAAVAPGAGSAASGGVVTSAEEPDPDPPQAASTAAHTTRADRRTIASQDGSPGLRDDASVELREVTEADIEAFFAHQADPESSAMAAVPSREHQSHVEHWGRVLADPAIVKRTIVADGQAVGHVVRFDREGRALVGYWIARDHWGRGIATAALAEFLTLLDERPLFATAAAHNTVSQRVLEKAGFTEVSRETADDGVEVVLFTLA
jgi:RimJ/RimL family protein N-acetyltransferase